MAAESTRVEVQCQKAEQELRKFFPDKPEVVAQIMQPICELLKTISFAHPWMRVKIQEAWSKAAPDCIEQCTEFLKAMDKFAQTLDKQDERVVNQANAASNNIWKDPNATFEQKRDADRDVRSDQYSHQKAMRKDTTDTIKSVLKVVGGVASVAVVAVTGKDAYKAHSRSRAISSFSIEGALNGVAKVIKAIKK